MYCSKCRTGQEADQLMASLIWGMIWAVSKTVTEEIHFQLPNDGVEC